MEDLTLTFSDKQKITATANATNVVDTVGGGNDYSKLWVEIDVKEDFATLTSLKAELIESDSDDLSTPTTLAVAEAQAASLKKGFALMKMRLPLFKKRFLGIKYTVGGSSATAGAVSAYITDAVETACE